MIAFDAESLRDVARWVHKYERYWTKEFDQLEDYFREKGEVNKHRIKNKNHRIEHQGTIDASPSEVFDAWIDPTSRESPWCGVTKAIVNRPKVDGLFL
jgi:hypothetical protein